MTSKNFIVVILISTITCATACSNQKQDDEKPNANFNGYWMVIDHYDRLNLALKQNSCAPILGQIDLHQTVETINLRIISIWGNKQIFALDTIIRDGATGAKAHPKSVTAANIPGRFVDQGDLFTNEETSILERVFVPSEGDLFTLAPFEVEDLEKKTLLFFLEKPNLLIFTMINKSETLKADQNSVGNIAQELAEQSSPFQLNYKRITLQEYSDFVDFSQACL